MAVVVVAAAFPAAASQDMSVLRHVTLISFLSLAFMASLVVPWRRADDDPLVQNGRCHGVHIVNSSKQAFPGLSWGMPDFFIGLYLRV